jgi:hypothetical protein
MLRTVMQNAVLYDISVCAVYWYVLHKEGHCE